MCFLGLFKVVFVHGFAVFWHVFGVLKLIWVWIFFT